jgi:hypothetical protein
MNILYNQAKQNMYTKYGMFLGNGINQRDVILTNRDVVRTSLYSKGQ